MGRRASGCGHRAGYALPGMPWLATSAPPVGFPEALCPGTKHVPGEIILHFLPCVMKHLPLKVGTLLLLASSGLLTPRSTLGSTIQAPQNECSALLSLRLVTLEGPIVPFLHHARPTVSQNSGDSAPRSVPIRGPGCADGALCKSSL